MTLLCLLGLHRRSENVWWDGFDYRSSCRRCDAPLYKHGNVHWRRVTPKREALFLRYQESRIDAAQDSRSEDGRPTRA